MSDSPPATLVGHDPPAAVPSEHFREVMTRFATCVTVVTALDDGRPAGCTATAVMPLTDLPPTMAVSLITGSGTEQCILRAGTFAVNVLSWGQGDLVGRFATREAARRFDGVPYRDDEGAPVLDGVAAGVVCELVRSVPLLDHTLLVGTVRRAWGTDEEPLVLHRREGHRLTP